MANGSLKIGLGFGIASGVITTVGLMIGLYSSTFSKGIVLAGILTVAIADSFSDALGIHFSEESSGLKSTKQIWQSTIFTLISKFIITISFLPLILLLPLKLAVILDVIYGVLILLIYSFILAKKQNNNPYKAILEHLSIMFLVLFITYYTGRAIDKLFL